MIEEYNVRWSIEAIYDVADIEDYIEENFGRDRADQFDDDIDSTGHSLSTNYRLSSNTGMIYRGLVIQKKIIRPSILFFCVDDDMKTVYILRVLRHERNWQKMLRETTVYSFND